MHHIICTSLHVPHVLGAVEVTCWTKWWNMYRGCGAAQVTSDLCCADSWLIPCLQKQLTNSGNVVECIKAYRSVINIITLIEPVLWAVKIIYTTVTTHRSEQNNPTEKKRPLHRWSTLHTGNNLTFLPTCFGHMSRVEWPHMLYFSDM